MSSSASRGSLTPTRDFYALQVFANAVGGGMSSRLFQEVRETRGLAYAIHAFHWGYSDTGLFGFYAATGAKDVARTACRSRSIASAERRRI